MSGRFGPGASRADGGFEDFVRDRSTSLFRVALLLTGERTSAEDLLQTALLRTARRWATAHQNPEAYTRRVLVNLARDEHRRRSRRVVVTPAADERTTPAAGDMADRAVERDALFVALGRLPQRQREVVVLRFYLDLSVQETAEALGCSTGTVKSYSARAVARLRTELDQPTIHVPDTEVRNR